MRLRLSYIILYIDSITSDEYTGELDSPILILILILILYPIRAYKPV